MSRALNGNPSQSYGSSLWDHPELPATRPKWIHHTSTPAIIHHTLTPARQASTRFTYPSGIEG